MKYSLYGLGEGILADSSNSLYVVSDQHCKVLDASISLRKVGICKGMELRTARALCGNMQVLAEMKGPSKAMQRILSLLCTFTPWIQTERNDAFYIQLSDEMPPVQEVRTLLKELDKTLSVEQRMRVGFAENPFLSRALVEWSQIERVPDALYRRVGRQHLIISPGLIHFAREEKKDGIVEWWGRLPVGALWILPQSIRKKLNRLGVHRLKDLKEIPDYTLVLHFGKESLLWKQNLNQQMGGSLFVNYPTYEKKSFWIADIHNRPHISSAWEIAGKLSQDLSSQLSRLHVGAMKIGLRWRTDQKEDAKWRACKQPVFRSGDIYARIHPFLNELELQGTVMDYVEIWGAVIKPISGIQTSFVLHDNQFQMDSRSVRADMKDIFSEINTRFPSGLRRGVKPSFREVRLYEVMERV